MIPPALKLFLKTALALQGLLCFHKIGSWNSGKESA